MTSSAPEKVVFDCPVFTQALINPAGPAGFCLTSAQQGRIILFVSDYVLQEIRELPLKLKPKLGVTPDRIDDLIRDLAKYARFVDVVLQIFQHPIDPDDSHYVNLALSTSSNLLVTRDHHLLDLMSPATPEAREFMRSFPLLKILTPDVLAARLHVP